MEIASALCIYQLENTIILPDQAWFWISAMRDLQVSELVSTKKNQSHVVIGEEYLNND